MGTITFEVHPITPTSPRNTLATIFKSILILFTFDFLCIFFLLSISCIDIYKKEKEREREREREREEIPNYVKLKHHNFAMLKHKNVIQDFFNPSHKKK